MGQQPHSYRIVFLSTNDWSDLWRRRQRLAHELSQQPEVASVLYINPPVVTSVTDLARGRFEASHLGSTRRTHFDALVGRPRRVAERVWVYTGSQKTLPLSRFGRLRQSRRLLQWNATAYANRMRAALATLPGERLIVYLSHPTHAFALDIFGQRALACYDWTDDWMQFELLPMADREAYVQMDSRMPREADLVFAVSRNLYERACAVNPNAHWLPNATSLLEPIMDAPGPDPVVASIRCPRLGYIGHIGDRIDFGLLESVALARPTWSIIMIGPVWSNRAAQAESLGQLPNVHFLGARAYAALPSIMGQFDVCLIPHTRDQLTLSMDPIKLYDYLASGLPIVTTGVSGVERFSDVVNVANTPSDFIAEVERALAEHDGSLAKRRRQYASENSWPARSAELWGHIQEHLYPRLSEPGRTWIGTHA